MESPTECRTDEELVAAANEGELAAFEALYLRYREWVVNLAFRFTGDYDLALDVLQETFLYFLKKFPGFNLRAQLKTFLYPAVKNLALNACKKAERLQGGDAAFESMAAPGMAAGAGGEMDAMIAGLTAVHREVLLLRFVEELSLEEIAAALVLPVGTVKSRLHNALGQLRKSQSL